MKVSKKYVSLGLATMLRLGLLTGCGKEATQTDTAKEVSTSNVRYNVLDHFDENPGVKEYDVGQHIFFLRYDLGSEYAINVYSGSLTLFDGYEIVYIQNFDQKVGQNLQTRGFDVWYRNIIPVSVMPVWNERFECYDYSVPGNVIEKNVELETDSQMKLVK